MKNNHNILKAEGVQKEFDSWAKKTIKNIVDTVIRDYINDEKKRGVFEHTDYDDIASPRQISDFEKIHVILGASDLFLNAKILPME